MAYADQPRIVASVSTTSSVLVIALGDGEEVHYTYPPDGRFHVTPNAQPSVHSFLNPGPAYESLSYHPLVAVNIPTNPALLTRPSNTPSVNTMTIQPPAQRDGRLEIGVLGQKATDVVIQQLQNSAASVRLFQGPRSDTTIVFRYVT